MIKFLQSLRSFIEPSLLRSSPCTTTQTCPRRWKSFPSVCRMQRHAVVKILEGEARFTFSFLLSVPPEGKERQFNLCRELTEPPLLFSERIGTNVAKILNKKKKKKGGEETNEPPLIGVEFRSSSTVLSLGRQTWDLGPDI
jgi:hypothetical protein